ncbi:MAG: YcgL domain-containing protein [Xanthomonadales bacterium]|nr:YcgL domain-containing protein [Xanthomonadales bacterium]
MTLCTVYRSGKRAETYLYLSENMEFSDLPETLQRSFGEPQRIMEMELTAQRKLARADVNRVIENLEGCGYFLQMPPERPVEEEISRRFS